MPRPTVFELLDQNTRPILGLIALATALSGVAAYWAADSTFVGAVAAALVLLFVWNLSLWRESRPRKPIAGVKETGRHRRKRLAIHATSVTAGLAGIAVIAVLSHDPWSIRAQLYTRGCTALPNLERWIAARGRTDIPMRQRAAKCYDEQHRLADHLKAIELLVGDQQALSTLDPSARSELEGLMHADIGLDLLMSNDSALQTDEHQAADHLQEAALRRPGDWIVLDLLAAATSRAEFGRPNAAANVRHIMDDAQKNFDAASISPGDRSFHAHWRGRAFAGLAAHAEAEHEFGVELSLLPEGDPGVPAVRRLQRAEEYGRTGDLPALRRYLEQAPTAADRGEAAVNVVNALIDEADAADARGDAKEAAAKAAEALNILAIAQQLGAVGQDRADRVRLARLDQYAGNLESALAKWRQIVKEQPAKDLFWYIFGETARKARQFSEARDALATYVRRRPDDSSGHAALGMAILGMAEQEGPNDERAKLFRAAEAELAEAARLAPADHVIAGHISDAALERAQAVETAEAKQQAMEKSLLWARTALELLPTTATLPDRTPVVDRLASRLNELAYHYLSRNDDVVTATAYVDEALALRPDEPYAIDTKATILLRTAEKSTSKLTRRALAAEATRLLQTIATTLPPGDPQALAELHVHLGRAALLRGDGKAAKASFVRALKADPANAEARKLLK